MQESSLTIILVPLKQILCNSNKRRNLRAHKLTTQSTRLRVSTGNSQYHSDTLCSAVDGICVQGYWAHGSLHDTV